MLLLFVFVKNSEWVLPNRRRQKILVPRPQNRSGRQGNLLPNAFFSGSSCWTLVRMDIFDVPVHVASASVGFASKLVRSYNLNFHFSEVKLIYKRKENEKLLFTVIAVCCLDIIFRFDRKMLPYRTKPFLLFSWLI